MASFREDGLLPASGDDARAYAQLEWRATDSRGELRPPPPVHIVDRLVRAVIGGGLSEKREEALAVHPEAGTVATIRELPTCDLCKRRQARYDAAITLAGRSGGAYLCPPCYAIHGTGVLGIGRGQYLYTWAELRTDAHRDVRAAYRRACAFWGTQPVEFDG